MNRMASFILAYVVVYQLSLHYIRNTWVTVLVSLLLLLPFIFGIKIKLDKDVVKIAILGIFLEIFLLEPGIAFNRVSFHFYPSTLPAIIIYSALGAFSFCLILLGFKKSKIENFASRGLIFGAIILLFYYPYNVLIDPKIIFSLAVFNIVFMFFFAITVMFIYYKTNYNFIAAFIFLFTFILFNSLSINISVSKYYYLIWEMVTLSLIIFISDVVIKTSYQFENIFKGSKIDLKKAIRKSKSLIALIVVITIVSVMVTPGIVDHSYFVIGDPTGSMSPVIKPGSVLFVGPVKPSQVKVGEIIVFNAPWENGTLFAHQVIRICYIGGHEYFRTKGVANPSEDPKPVPTYDVKGHVLFSIPYLGYALIYSKVILAIIFMGVAGLIPYPSKSKKSWKPDGTGW